MADGEKLIVACPTCATLNRVPTSRMSEGGHCGHCSKPLFMGRPVELVSANFEKHAVSSDIPLIIDFWAAWCGPCRQMTPGFTAVAARVEPRARLGKIDIEAEQGLAARFSIRSIPSLIFMHKGREIARTAGAMPESALLQWIDQLLATYRQHRPARPVESQP